MYCTVGDNALMYEWSSAVPLHAMAPLAGEYTERCEGRGCTEFAAYIHHVRSACMRHEARESCLRLCIVHGNQLKRDAGGFMGVLGVERAPAYPVHADTRCVYSGCEARPFDVRFSVAGLARWWTNHFCSKHRPVAGVHRLRPRGAASV